MALTLDAFLRRSRESLSRLIKAEAAVGGAAKGLAAAAAKGPKARAPKTVHLVMGNESVDLDSVASSIVYSAWLGQQTDTDGGQIIACPVLNIPRADLALRTDVAWILNRVEVDAAALIFADDPDFDDLKVLTSAITLVDHNALLPHWADKQECVVEIIDHHEDKHLYPKALRLVRPSGSCASLVSARIGKAAAIRRAEAELLLGAIHADTAGMTQRVTADDSAAVAHLAALVPGLDLVALCADLEAAKADVSTLSLLECFRKDYKGRTMGGGVAVGVAAVPVRLEALAVKGSVTDAARQFAVNKKLDVLMVMTTFKDPDFSRQLAVYTPSPDTLEGLSRCLESNAAARDALQLERYVLGGFEGMAVYNQRNIASSRKKLLPLLTDLLSDGLPSP